MTSPLHLQVLGDHKGNLELWLQYIELVSEAAAQKDGSALSIRAAYRTALQVGMQISYTLSQQTAWCWTPKLTQEKCCTHNSWAAKLSEVQDLEVSA